MFRNINDMNYEATAGRPSNNNDQELGKLKSLFLDQIKADSTISLKRKISGSQWPVTLRCFEAGSSAVVTLMNPLSSFCWRWDGMWIQVQESPGLGNFDWTRISFRLPVWNNQCISHKPPPPPHTPVSNRHSAMQNRMFGLVMNDLLNERKFIIMRSEKGKSLVDTSVAC